MGQKAAIYCLVSTADQSCDWQAIDLSAFAKRGGYSVVKVFKETGSGTRLDSVERKKIMALAQVREIDSVLVTEIISMVPIDDRSTKHFAGIGKLESISDRFKWHDVRFVFPAWSDDGNVSSNIAEFERDLISERVKSGLSAAKSSWKKAGAAVCSTS